MVDCIFLIPSKNSRDIKHQKKKEPKKNMTPRHTRTVFSVIMLPPTCLNLKKKIKNVMSASSQLTSRKELIPMIWKTCTKNAMNKFVKIHLLPKRNQKVQKIFDLAIKSPLHQEKRTSARSRNP